MTNLVEVKKHIDKAKLNLMMARNTTFFSALLSNIKIVITEDIDCAGTDGITMWLNPNWIFNLPLPQVLGLLLHEIGHIIYEHVTICFQANLNQKIHNIAGDHYINLWLLSMGYELPPEGYADRKYRGWSTMKIYNDLMKNPPPPQQTQIYVMDLVKPPKGMAPEEHKERVTSNLMKAVLQAQTSKDAGSIPQNVLQIVEEATNPQLPWNVILMSYMDAYNRDDYSWARPNKRYLPDFYMPVLRSPAMDQMTCGADVSGSMDGEDLDTIIAEIRYIWDTLQPLKMRLQTFDTEVHLNEMYTQGDTLDDLELMGGGGTNVIPLLQSIEDEEPMLSLIFTDGYFSMPNLDQINTDIIWVIKDNPDFDPPKGRVIHF